MRNAVNLVMSATALKCLIDTQDTEWGKHWEIPVIVKEHDVFGKISSVVGHYCKLLRNCNLKSSII